MTRRGKFGALLIDRQQASRRNPDVSPFVRCQACISGNHRACKNRVRVPDANTWTDCYCHFDDHGQHPQGINLAGEVAGNQAEETAYEKTIGLDHQ